MFKLLFVCIFIDNTKINEMIIILLGYYMSSDNATQTLIKAIPTPIILTETIIKRKIWLTFITFLTNISFLF